MLARNMYCYGTCYTFCQTSLTTSAQGLQADTLQSALECEANLYTDTVVCFNIARLEQKLATLGDIIIGDMAIAAQNTIDRSLLRVPIANCFVIPSLLRPQWCSC